MKKVLALLLVLVLTMGMSTTAFAAAAFDKNDTSAPGFGGITLNAGVGFNGDATQPSDSTSVLIAPAMLYSGSLSGFITWTSIGYTRTDIGSKVTLRTKVSRGSSVIDEVKINYDTVTAASPNTTKFAHLYVSFVDPFKNNSLEGMEFSFEVYPVVDGKAWNEKGVLFEGTMTNTDTEVYSDTDLVDLFDGQIANVMEYNKKLEYNLGEGVSVWGKAVKNAKYWGVANNEPTEAQDEVMSQYDIDQIYNISHIGLASVAAYVKLNDVDPSAYVYDKNMNYIGRGKDELDFSETYYLASAMLDIEEEEEEEEPEDEEFTDDPVAPPDLGGDDGYLDNVNDNPSTGK